MFKLFLVQRLLPMLKRFIQGLVSYLKIVNLLQCAKIIIAFIGPKAETIDAMGNKINARQLMQKAKVPVIPGSDGVIDSVEEALTIAEEIGYPVMLKAAAGGGGKGIRKVLSKEELPKHFTSAQQEAKAAFGNDDMYLEKIIYPARHIEVQIFR